MLEATGFYIKWKDMQAIVPVVAGALSGTVNAPTASSPGVELAARWSVNQAFRLGAMGSWNDARIDGNVIVDALLRDPVTGLPTGNTTPTVVFYRNDRLNDVPEWTGALTFDFTQPFANDRLLFVTRGGVQYASERESRSYGTGVTGDASTTLDLRVGIEGMQWGLYLFGTNLTNEDALVSPIQSSTRADYGMRYRPRTVGINFKFDY